MAENIIDPLKFIKEEIERYEEGDVMWCKKLNGKIIIFQSNWEDK